LQEIFAKSYGAWGWSNATNSYQATTTGASLTTPATVCAGNVRGATDTCAIPPTVSNISFDGAPVGTIRTRGFINLTFNSNVDKDQIPLKEYVVDWGDGEKTTVDGNMIPRSGSDKPHSASHSYDYYDLLNKYNSANHSYDYPMLDCSKADQCTIAPRIKLQDNWGWCTEGYSYTSGTTTIGVPCPNTGKCAVNNYIASCTHDTEKNSSDVSGCATSGVLCSDGFSEPVSGNSITVYKE